jgi:hypothetical protein
MSIVETRNRLSSGFLGKTLTPAPEALRLYGRLGVAFFIRNPEGSVLLILENTGKSETGKVPGQYGIPCETLHVAENDVPEEYEAGLIRGLHEEIGVPHEKISSLFGVDPDTCYVGEGPVSGTFARVFEIQFIGRDVELAAIVESASGESDREVDVLGWMDPVFFQRYPLREATTTILRSYTPQKIRRPNPAGFLPLSIESLRVAQHRCLED